MKAKITYVAKAAAATAADKLNILKKFFVIIFVTSKFQTFKIS